jgi:hypothetical protein
MAMLKNTLNAIKDETTSPSTLKNLLFQGKSLMDETRQQISIFQEEEERLLKKRNQLLNAPAEPNSGDTGFIRHHWHYWRNYSSFSV